MPRYSIPSVSSFSDHSEGQEGATGGLRVPSVSDSSQDGEASLTGRSRRSMSPSPSDRTSPTGPRSPPGSAPRASEGFDRSKSPFTGLEDSGLTDERSTTSTPVESIENIEEHLHHENIGLSSDRTGSDPDNEHSLHNLLLSKRRPPTLPTEKSLRGLPESLIWHTLTSLLKAVSYLHTGHDGRPPSTSTEDNDGWMPIVHNTINPAHIYYIRQTPQPDVRRAPPTYERCKLRNFTRSVVLPGTFEPVSDEEVADRREAFEHLYFSGEKTGFEAPEIVGDDNDIPGPANDLWSIGAVMIAMMTGGRSIWDLVLDTEFLDQAKSNKRRLRGALVGRWRETPLIHRHVLLQSMAGSSDIVSALPEVYSLQLRVLTEALLAFDPRDRGEAWEVLDDVVAAVNDRTAQGLEDYREPSEAEKLIENEKRYRQVVEEATRWLDDIEAAEQLQKELQEAADLEN